jgi:hypothetical protein
LAYDLLRQQPFGAPSLEAIRQERQRRVSLLVLQKTRCSPVCQSLQMRLNFSAWLSMAGLPMAGVSTITLGLRVSVEAMRRRPRSPGGSAKDSTAPLRDDDRTGNLHKDEWVMIS